MKNILLITFFSVFLTACTSELSKSRSIKNLTSPTHLRVEGIQSPLNVHNSAPRLSWHANVTTQDAYQVQVASSKELLSSGIPDLWDSGKVNTRKSLNITYQGKKLKSGQTAYWRVRVWSDEQTTTQVQGWSEANKWEMGLINKQDWHAKWIQVEKPSVADITKSVTNWMLFAANLHESDSEGLSESKRQTQKRVLAQLTEQPTASLFRHTFEIMAYKKVVKARLHSTAAGYYEIFINGKKVDDRIADPGQTDFDKRILYNTDDVLPFLFAGNNSIGVHLGSGWYDENIAFSKWENPDAKEKSQVSRSLSYGQPKFIAQLELTFEDGSKQIVVSDQNWLSHPSPVLKEGIFSGELFDANKAIKTWHSVREVKKDESWKSVQVLSYWPTRALEPQLLPPIRTIEKMTAKTLYQPKEKVWVLDFGQNFTGVPTLHLDKLDLKQGQTIHLRYAEWADIDGNISQKTGGGAPLLKQVDSYIAASDEAKTWRPSFTWHGFRYIEITGLEKAPELDAVTAHLVRSDVARVGQFSSSNALINRIHDMALWSYESNLMALPMDCPIRERAGWTGDAHAALITGNYNFNMQNFWQKYLGDFKTAQYVAPAVVPGKRTHGGNFDWAAAEIIIAWENYRHYGDIQTLDDQYASMMKYMQAGEAKLEDSLLRIGYGDWCDPVRKPGMGRQRCNPEYTPPTATSSALFAHTANLMAKISSLLNKPSEAKHFSHLYNRIAKQYHQEFYDPDTGHYGSQTADAMALQFGLAPLELRQKVAAGLNRDVLENWNGHGSVGALGQTYLYKSLSDFGYGDTAFNIFTAEGYPGYQWQFDKLNATTLWERKGVIDPSLDPDRRNAPGRSLNHPFHSGYDGWFYEGLGGIRLREDSVGYQDFALKPVFAKDLDSVTVSYKTGYGTIQSRWWRENSRVKWEFVVPNNTTALVTLPNQKSKLYRAGAYTLVAAE
ncbi:family 78 glycoside hydrolase catalytic domain [Aliiglaciecola sp. 3_MG-2023]|uniref:alpha-L-rhamnosidase n=1 Tax=Aliiglaciecola sp. 3_MG-2023 TaxID=3062644 RepID=UPI0026E487DA|nr:alpha-L-rhamnosidase [Aliiglaciecola sp. 3_MG-2023]MDO6693309.1 family 78 glycoside hydrolase catalytic domain [Aliiglaciecola sp. 3_MG-2023]